LMPFWRMQAAYFNNASCVSTVDDVPGVVPAVEPSEATWADALLPEPQAVAMRATASPRSAIV